MKTKLIIRRYLRFIRNWLWLVILGGLIAGGANYFLTSTTPKYEATTTVIVGQLLQQAVPDQNDAPLIERLSAYYLELLRRQTVVEGVKTQLNLNNIPDDVLVQMMTSRIVPQTSIIEIKITDTNPNEAIQLANAFATELIKQSPTAPQNQPTQQRDFIQTQLKDLQSQIETGQKNLADLNTTLNNTTDATAIADLSNRIKGLQTQLDTWQSNYITLLRQSAAASPNSLSVLEQAKQAVVVKDLSPVIRTVLITLAGIVIALGFAILMEYLDDRIKHADDIAYTFKVPVLAQLPASISLEVPLKPKARNQEAQAYEILSTSLLFSEDFSEQQRTLLVTAPDSLKEQDAVVVKLAKNLIGFGQSVILINANVLDSSLGNRLIPAKAGNGNGNGNDSHKAGFYEIFYGKTYQEIENMIYTTTVPNLSLMPAGRLPDEDRVELNLPTGAKPIYELLENFQTPEIAIVNGGNILEDKTSRLLVPHTGGVILLCKIKNTRYQELKMAIETVERLKGNLLGIVVIESKKVASQSNVKVKEELDNNTEIKAEPDVVVNLRTRTTRGDEKNIITGASTGASKSTNYKKKEEEEFFEVPEIDDPVHDFEATQKLRKVGFEQKNRQQS